MSTFYLHILIFALDFTLTGYPITFIAMFSISIATSALTTNMKEQAKVLSEREKLLMEAEKEKMSKPAPGHIT